MKRVIFFYFIFLSSWGYTQSNNCQRILSEAEQLAINGEYDRAINKYNAVKVCDESLTNVANRGLKKVFKLIEGEKIEADKQRDLARKEASRADNQAKIAEERRAEEERQKKEVIRQKKLVEEQRNRAISQQKKAELAEKREWTMNGVPNFF